MSKRDKKKARLVLALLLSASMMFSCKVMTIPIGICSVFAADTDSEASCGYTEHVHGEDCSEEVLVCGLTESEGTEGHVHTEACYETELGLICDLEEAEPESGHIHSDDCYEKTMTCTLEEHEHELSCYSNPNADTESADTESADTESADTESADTESAQTEEAILLDSADAGSGELPTQPGLEGIENETETAVESETETAAESETETVDDPEYFTGVISDNAIRVTDEKGLSLVIRIDENDPSGDGILYTNESAAIVIEAENHSDFTSGAAVFRIYCRFDDDDYTMPANFTDDAVIAIPATAAIDGDSCDVEIHLGIHSVGEGLWCWEIDGSELIPGLALDYTATVCYANGTSGGTMTVFAECVSKEDAAGDYALSQPMDSYETVMTTWATEAGTFHVSESNDSTPAIAFTENEDGTSSYYLKNVSYTIQPKISSNSSNNFYGADCVTNVSYHDVLVLGDGLAWADGIIEAVENGEYYGVAGGFSGNTYHRYLYVRLDGEEYLLCDIRCGGSSTGGDPAQNMDTVLYVNDAGDLCLYWEIDNRYTGGTAATIDPSSFHIVYADGAVVITNPEERNEFSSYEISSSVEATATLRDSKDQNAGDAVNDVLAFSLMNGNGYDNRVLTIKETDTNGIELADAAFTLTMVTNQEIYYYDGESWTTDKNATIQIGSVEISGPVDGDYTLTEMEAPSGYLALGDPIHFTIENGVSSLAEGSGSQVSLDQNGDSILITVANSAARTMPDTGGSGTRVFMVCGLRTLLAALCLMFLYRKKYAIKY